MKQDCMLCTRQYPVLQKMTDLIRQHMCIKFCFKSVKIARETFEMLKKPQTVFLEQCITVPKEGHRCSCQCEVPAIIFFFGQSSECASQIHYTHSKTWINISGQTFYHMPGKMCGEKNMTVLLTTLLCMCRNFWLIMM